MGLWAWGAKVPVLPHGWGKGFPDDVLCDYIDLLLKVMLFFDEQTWS